MKLQEIILDILGILLILLSLYGFYFLDVDFNESTFIGVTGLALFVLKGSSIRKMVEALIEKYLKK